MKYIIVKWLAFYTFWGILLLFNVIFPITVILIYNEYLLKLEIGGQIRTVIKYPGGHMFLPLIVGHVRLYPDVW